MESYICPHSKTCLIYQNWVEQTNNNRLNIILSENEFSCLAYDALKDAETGIPNGNLEGREIGDDCAYILGLNLKKNIILINSYIKSHML